MMLRRTWLMSVCTATLAGSTVLAQQAARIPIRHVTTLATTDSGVIANVYIVRVMSDGSILLNDASKRRLLLIDTSMKKFKIVADTAGESKNNFGNNLGGLLFYPGDSTAFVDRASQALITVDRLGNFGAVSSPPKASDMQYFVYSASSNYGLPGFDTRGRLYYRAGLRLPALGFDPTVKDTVVTSADSAPIVRADLDARTIDTLAYVRIPVQMSKITPAGGGSVRLSTLQNPLPVMDDWAYLNDGTVAIVRAQDYHIDWLLPDGSRKSTPKMPFDWRQITPEEKHRMVDSVQHLLDSVRSAAVARAVATNPGRGNIEMSYPRNTVVPLEKLPDYYPPLRIGTQIRVDLEGNLWIMPSTSLQAQGGILYDVVNRNGEIIERVQLPAGRNLHGFAPGGIIYMSIPGNMNAQFGWPRLEKAQVIRP